MDDLAGREIFIEIKQTGSILRVAAIDARTGIEAVLSAPANMPRAAVQKAAIQKLRYVLEKRGCIAVSPRK